MRNWMQRLATTTLSVAMATVMATGLSACGSDTPTSTTPGPSSDGDGKMLYAQSCASCHGADLRGTDKGPSHLSQVYKSDHHGDDAFRSAVANGSRQHHWNFGDMPAVEGLSAPEVEAIIAFVREQQDTNGFETYPPTP